VIRQEGKRMKKSIGIAALLSGVTLGSTSYAATGLDAYVDKNGFIDVQALTCAQLADTYQEDANALANWYSGWYNGLAKKHYYHLSRVKGTEHEVIVFCKEHRDMKIIKAMDIIFKEERQEKK
jgi:hypothetical protein